MSLLERISPVSAALARAGRGAAGQILARDVQPLEGTRMSLWNTIIPAWWTENGLNAAGQMFWPGNGLLADRTWITNRCLQMNSQQIASMPLRFNPGNATTVTEPAWMSNPDPLYYPNGIGSMIKALMRDYYGWGWCLLYVTSRYADGYPRTFTRIPAARCEPMWDENGYRQYPVGGQWLNPEDVIQIDRDCGDGWLAHGTSAIRSYAQLAWGLLAAGNQAMEVNQGGIPKVSLKVTDENRKLTDKQATNLQDQWQEKTQKRSGAPPVLPYGLDFETLSWSPKDMALLETQEFNALALAAAFGIPAVLLNMAIRWGMTYQNPGMLGEMWWRFELRPSAKELADALTAQALPAGQWCWFDATDTFLQIEPQNTAQEASPVATEEDDPQAAAVEQDASTAAPSQAEAPAVASASPAQQSQAPRLTVLGGNR
jgi:HK97 family phage portal protein